MRRRPSRRRGFSPSATLLIHWTTSARIEIEDRFPRGILQDLSASGHRFQKIGRKGEVRYGYAAAIVVDTRIDASKERPNPGDRMRPCRSSARARHSRTRFARRTRFDRASPLVGAAAFAAAF